MDGRCLDAHFRICFHYLVKTDGLKRAKRSQSTPGPTSTAQKRPTSSGDVEAPVKLRHLLLLLGVGIVILAVLSFALEAYWERKQPVFQDAPKLIAALQAYSRDRFIHGMKIPASISLNDLVSAGYLTTNDVRAFDGIEVTITTSANGTNSQNVLIHARMPDGSVVTLLQDGSVQQESRQTPSGQPVKP